MMMPTKRDKECLKSLIFVIKEKNFKLLHYNNVSAKYFNLTF